MRCLECGAESAEAVQVCAGCGAPIAYSRSAAAVAADSAAGPGTDGGSQSAATTGATGATGVTLPILPTAAEPAADVPVWPKPRQMPRGYSWMACALVLGGWALLAVGGYFQQLGSPFDRRYVLAAIVPGVLALILFGQHIRWSLFLARPGAPASATVIDGRRGGRRLTLDAPRDGHPSGLKVRLAWWAEPAMLAPGENVTLYGRRGGTGQLLVSPPDPDRALVGTGRRWKVSLPGWKAPQNPSYYQRTGRYLRWGPMAIFGLGVVAAVVATLIATVPPLTGHVSMGDLRQGDCLTGSSLDLGGSNPWPDWVAGAPCTSQHLAEVFFAGNAWPQAMAYPGDAAVGDQADARCQAEFKAYDGIDNSTSAFTISSVVPGPADDWASGDRQLICVAYQATPAPVEGTPVDYSIKGSHK